MREHLTELEQQILEEMDQKILDTSDIVEINRQATKRMLFLEKVNCRIKRSGS